MKKVFAFLLTIAMVFSVCTMIMPMCARVRTPADFAEYIRDDAKNFSDADEQFLFWREVAKKLRDASNGATLSITVPANIDQTKVPTFLFDALADAETKVILLFEKTELEVTLDASMKPNTPAAITFIFLKDLGYDIESNSDQKFSSIGSGIEMPLNEKFYFDLLKGRQPIFD